MTTPSPAEGYRPKVRSKIVTCTWEDLAPAEDSPPLWARLQSNLSFLEIEEIPSPYRTSDEGTLLIHANDELRTIISRYVLEWNATARNLKTGVIEAVPPPAEIGINAFRAVDWRIGAWLASELKLVHMSDPTKALEKKEPSSASSPESASDAA